MDDLKAARHLNELDVTNEDLMNVYNVKYRRFGEPGWGPRQRLKFGYFQADDHYEALVNKLVQSGCSWADVGCGRDIFPSNPDLAETIAARCSSVFGIDPDQNIEDNPLITDKFRGPLEEWQVDRQFDVVTLRMVAEHIQEPEKVVGSLAEMTREGGRVVVYTPNKYSPVPLLTSVVPFAWHNPIKRVLWNTESRDTFPTAFRMNTRSCLRRYFEAGGFVEDHFQYLDDCSVTSRFRLLNFLELSVRNLFHRLGLHYPENCLLGVYRRVN